MGNIIKLLVAGGLAYIGWKIYKQIPKLPNGKIPTGLKDIQDLTQLETEKFLTNYYSWSYEPSEIEKSFAKIFSLFNDFIKQSTASSTYSENFYYKLSKKEYEEFAKDYENNRIKYEGIINKIYQDYPYLFKVKMNIFDEQSIYHYFDIDYYKNLYSPVFKTENDYFLIQLGQNEKQTLPVKILSMNFDTIFENYRNTKDSELRWGLDRENELKKQTIDRIIDGTTPSFILEKVIEGLGEMKDINKENSELWTLQNELKVFLSKKETELLLMRADEMKNKRELIINTYKSQEQNQEQVKWSWILSYVMMDYITYEESMQSEIAITTEEDEMRKKLQIENLNLNYKFLSYDYPYVNLDKEQKVKEVLLPKPKNTYKTIIENKDIFGSFLETVKENVSKVIKIYLYRKNM